MTRLEVLKAEKEQIKGLHCLSFGLIDKCIEWYDKEIEAIVIHGADNKFYGQQADRNEFYNWDAPIRHKADGEYISRQAVLDLVADYDLSMGQVVRGIHALPPVKPQESSRDIEEIEEVINCDADAETKCKMISNILTAKPHYFEEQEPKTDNDLDMKLKLMEANINGYTQGLKDASNTEQEPSEYAVDREQVNDILGHCIHSQEDYYLAIKMLNELPSVKPQKWIYVSEKMPKDGQYVLFCDIDDDIMIGYHVKGRPNTHFSQDGTWDDIKNVRAWMPLPKPYEPQESEVSE